MHTHLDNISKVCHSNLATYCRFATNGNFYNSYLISSYMKNPASLDNNSRWEHF